MRANLLTPRRKVTRLEFISILIALVVPRQAAFAAMIYFVLGPLHATYGFMRGHTRDRLPAAA